MGNLNIAMTLGDTALDLPLVDSEQLQTTNIKGAKKICVATTTKIMLLF